MASMMVLLLTTLCMVLTSITATNTTQTLSYGNSTSRITTDDGSALRNTPMHNMINITQESTTAPSSEPTTEPTAAEAMSSTMIIIGTNTTEVQEHTVILTHANMVMKLIVVIIVLLVGLSIGIVAHCKSQPPAAVKQQEVNMNYHLLKDETEVEMT
eukprot:765235_1